jgi:nucleotide-binding universal stress UspA family protein
MTDAVLITRILVPVDPDEDGGPALHYATGLARRFGAEIVLMVANETLGIVPASEHARRVREQTTQRLAPEVDRLCRLGVASRVIPCAIQPPGDEADAIVSAAAEEHADLVVMETHGRRGLERIAHLGSVAERVVRASPCPVLVLRRATERAN